jgi:hypothetical protein
MLASWSFWILVAVVVGGSYILARGTQYFADGWRIPRGRDIRALDIAVRRRRRKEFVITYFFFLLLFAGLVFWRFNRS